MDGLRLVTAGEDKTARVWRLHLNTAQKQIFTHAEGVTNAVFTPDGEKAITGCSDGAAAIWDVADAREEARVAVPTRDVRIAVAPDGKTLAVGGADGVVRFYEFPSGKEQPMSFRQASGIETLTYSRNRPLLLVTSGDFQKGEACVFDLEKGQLSLPALPHRQKVLGGDFSRDGRRFVTVSEDQTARVWDLAADDPKPRIIQHQNAVRGGKISPDGRLLITGDWNGNAYLWDVETAKPRGTVLKHSGAVMAAAFGLDGRLVITGSWDGAARLWDVATGKRVYPPFAHGMPVISVDVHPRDANTFMTTSMDYTARIWTIPHTIEGSPEQVARWIRLATGLELDENNEARLLEPNQWLTQRRQMGDAGESPRVASAGPRRGFIEPPDKTLTRIGDNWRHQPPAVRPDPSRPSYLNFYRSASLLLDDDSGAWQIDLARGFDYLQGQQWENALESLAKVEAAKQGNCGVHSGKGEAHVGLSQWSLAVTEFEKAIFFHPAAIEHWRDLSAALLRARNSQRRQTMCRQLAARFAKTADPATAYRALRMLALGSDHHPKADELIRLAEVVERQTGEPTGAMGVALYRAGDFTAAGNSFERAKRLNALTVYELLFAAMTEHRLGRDDEARASLQTALRNTRQRGLTWVELAELDTLREEAIALIRSGK